MSGVERMSIVVAQMRRVVRKPYLPRMVFNRNGTITPAVLVPAYIFKLLILDSSREWKWRSYPENPVRETLPLNEPFVDKQQNWAVDNRST
jgi:hypothetical protein